MARFLGLDASTQSLTACLVEDPPGEVVCTESVQFDEELPQYGTRMGQLPSADPTIGQAPPLLWVEALDVLLGRLRDQGVELGRVRAISGAAQQHGSVYLNATFGPVLASLDPGRPLADQLAGTLSRPVAPIWTDSSTREECAILRAALGGTAGAARTTGSDVFERFTGPQIARFARQEPAAYASTAHIALVSSFVCSLLAGRIAPLDWGDGSGTNLMEIGDRRWHQPALDAVAPGLRQRLPELVPAQTVVGPLAPYLVRRFGFSPDAQVVVFTGDNPSSLIGVGLVEPGDVAISLGTSDTYFALLADLQVDETGQGHVFVAPTNDPMCLLCVRNGASARERVRDRYGLDWDGFEAAIARTAPGNEGRGMLPFFEPEIAPRLANPLVRRFGGLEEGNAEAECRAVVECQLVSMKLHSEWTQTEPKTIRLTGGASSSSAIRQIVADVFGCPVTTLDCSNTAALGGAVRAAQAWYSGRGEAGEWHGIAERFSRPASVRRSRPRLELAAAYALLERRLVRTLHEA